MKKYLLCFSLFMVSLSTMAQTTLTVSRLTQPTDSGSDKAARIFSVSVSEENTLTHKTSVPQTMNCRYDSPCVMSLHDESFTMTGKNDIAVNVAQGAKRTDDLLVTLRFDEKAQDALLHSLQTNIYQSASGVEQEEGKQDFTKTIKLPVKPGDIRDYQVTYLLPYENTQEAGLKKVHIRINELSQ